MKLKTRLLILLPIGVMALSAIGLALPRKTNAAFATYTNGDAATYYNSIDDSQSGNTLLTALRTLNLSKRQSTVGYSSMGTTPSGQFKYTDYDPNTVQYDSNGQPYGTKISSFYTYTSATSWNREHVWPNSHGGGSGGDAGTPYPDADIHMPRPTISSENSSRGNSFFVEGMNHSSNGWDPYTAGYSAESRGEAARITFYCTLVNSKLILAPNNTTPSGTDSVTGQSYGSGHTMGNLETLIKWNINYPVTQREKNRNEGAEYLQGNRNAFVDHPEYACKIWGNVNSTIKNMCSNASWDTGASVSISRSTASITVDDTTTISATASDSSTITWTTSDATVVTVSSGTSASGANVTLTGIGPGTATITAKATIESTVYTATCTVTVSSSGGSGGGEQDDGVTIAVSDIPSTYSTNSFTTASGYSFGCSNIGNSYSSGNMQWKSGQGYMYNTTPITGITKISMASPSTGSFSGTVYVGSSSHPTSGTSYSLTSGSSVNITGSPSYFTIQAGSVSGGAKCGAITIAQASSTVKTLSSISVSTAPTKTTYTAGEYFNPTGLVITRTYSDSTSDTYTYANHTSEFSFTPTTSTALTTSNTSVTISYGGKSCTQTITVNAAAKTLSSIAVSTAPTKTTYTAGEYFDPTGLVIRRNYSDSTYDTYTYANHTSEFTFSPTTSTALTTSNVSVTITYSGKSCSQAITVNAATKTLSSISVSGYKAAFTVDDTFTFGGIVTAHFSDSSTSDVTASATFTGYNMSQAGNQTVTVSYTYGGTTKTTTYSITVSTSGGSQTEDNPETITMSEQGFTSGQDATTATGTNATVTFSKNGGNNSPKYYDSGNAVRVYPSNTITVASQSLTIIKITITFGSSDGSNSITSSPSGWSSPDWTGSANSVVFTIGGSNGNRRISAITVYYEESGSTDPVTSISATVSKTFYVGETISTSDITVKDNNNKTVTGFSFANNGYQFTYSDASSGGAATSKTFANSVTYESLTCSLTVQVQRKAYVTPSGTSTLEHTGSEFRTAGISAGASSNYFEENQTATVDGVTFTVDGYVFTNTSPVALSFSKSKSSATGSLVSTTPYPSGITDVTVSGASPDIQLSVDGSTWVDLSSATPETVNYYYLKVFYKNTSQSSYVNITSFTVTLKAGETPENVANYVMYEDTNNQCTTKFDTAKGYFENLSPSGRATFMTSNDYVIATGRERLQAWAKHEGKQIVSQNGDYVITSASRISMLSMNENKSLIVVVITIASISFAGVLGLYILKRRKEQ